MSYKQYFCQCRHVRFKVISFQFTFLFSEQFEMLKALYDFKATFAKTLSFQESDMFILHQVNTKQRNWWQVVNSNGQVGYVPSNYVTTIQVRYF